MKAKAILAIAAVAATMTACSPSQTKVEEVAPENNPDMGVIDKGDSLVVIRLGDRCRSFRLGPDCRRHRRRGPLTAPDHYHNGTPERVCQNRRKNNIDKIRQF